MKAIKLATPIVFSAAEKAMKKATKHIKNTEVAGKIQSLFELEDLDAPRPSRVVSTLLGTADKAVNLAVRPLGKRKKRSWKHMYEDKWERDAVENFLNESDEQD